MSAVRRGSESSVDFLGDVGVLLIPYVPMRLEFSEIVVNNLESFEQMFLAYNGLHNLEFRYMALAPFYSVEKDKHHIGLTTNVLNESK